MRTAALTLTLLAAATCMSPHQAMAQVFRGTGPALAPTEGDVTTAPLADGTAAPMLPVATTRPLARPVVVSGPAPTDAAVPDYAAEEGATLLADHVDLSGDRVLTATGGVVMWYDGARLIASRVVYDGGSGQLTIDGPIHLTRPDQAGGDQETILIADGAELDEDLQDGILRGARLVLAREIQFAAAEVRRTGQGRMTTLTHVVASSCQICASDPTPLWEIRARRITHDAETRRISFDRPQFRAFGLPLGILPVLTAPDPTVERMTGFLRPRLRTTSALGLGVKLPYFITMGDHADLTVTPYLAVSRTATVELRYRQAFANGVTEWNGAISRDDILPDETRGYLFGAARFALPRDYSLTAQLQTASDRAYLLDYDITDADRLWSGVTLERYRRDRMLNARVGNYQTLRDDEDDATSPGLVANTTWQRAFSPPAPIGGRGWLEWSVHAHRRSSDTDQIGRDMLRGSVAADWRRQQVLPLGVVGSVQTRVDADLFRILQDSRFDSSVARVDPTVAAELRWPLIARSSNATHMLEPVAQLIWTPERKAADEVPNEDSTLIEFDEGNLFSLNRSPGWDRRETGLRANLGIGWTRIDPTGWSLGLTAGRVLRADGDGDLGGPLSGRRSDWLLAAHYADGRGLAVSNRALFDDGFDMSSDELRLGLLRPGVQISAGYLWIDAEAQPGRERDVSELSATTGLQIAPGWWATTDARYDFAASRTRETELGLQYRNECITVDMSVARRLTESESVSPDTRFGLSVQLGGFGRQAEAPGQVARRSCLR
ncbi:LPS assembly protein LptD [uncultured Paracoccus sp.]|uniref:LPS-assembly protein LptD n=1 Tax=uncultured Paracoccus sp. TaxID=189685 RepID=UPI00262B559F|nr:LPS assembly protein LptD [uncultured Paracoccus sp.]